MKINITKHEEEEFCKEYADYSFSARPEAKGFFDFLSNIQREKGMLFELLENLSKTKESGVSLESTGRFKIDFNKLVFSSSRDATENLLRGALLSNENGNISYILKGFKGGPVERNVDFCRFAKSSTKYLEGAIKSGDLKTSTSSVSRHLLAMRPSPTYSFSRFASDKGPEKWQKMLSNEVFDLGRSDELNSIFISWRPVDILLMSKGLTDSCYKKGGLFQFAPSLLASGPNTFVCYSTDGDTIDSRFFGFDYLQFTHKGRSYGSSRLSLVFASLLRDYVGVNATSFDAASPSRGVWEKLYPHQVYSQDSTNHSSRVYVNGENIEKELAEVFAKCVKLGGRGFHSYCANCGNMDNVKFGNRQLFCCDPGSIRCAACEEPFATAYNYENEQGQSICEDCFYDQEVWCADCSEFITNEEQIETLSGIYCTDCARTRETEGNLCV